MLNRAAVENARKYFTSQGYPQVKQEIAGRQLEYFLLPQSLEPSLPRFAMAVVSEDRRHHVFGVADTVPESYRPFWALHEHVEFLEEPEGPDKCRRALDKELGAVPAEAMTDYQAVRLQFFRDLITYTKTHSENSDPKDLAQTVAKYQKSLSRLEELAAKST